MDRVFLSNIELKNLSLSGFSFSFLIRFHTLLDVIQPTMENFFQKDKNGLKAMLENVCMSVQPIYSNNSNREREANVEDRKTETRQTSTEITRAIKYLIQSLVLALRTRMHIRTYTHIHIKTASSNYSLEFQCAANAAAASAATVAVAVANAFGMAFRASERASI